MTGALDWRAAAQVATTVRPSLLLPALVEVLDEVRGGDLWVWDQQRRTVASLGTGERRAPHELDDLAAIVRPLHVHGHRLGYVTLDVGPSVSDVDLAALSDLVAVAVAAGEPFDEVTTRRRRGAEMSLPAEIQWSLLPASERRLDGLRLSAAVEPAYDTGGDVFDHAVDGEQLFVAVLDARGHGLRASTISAVATGAMRRARRGGASLVEIAQEIDGAVNAVDESEFVSAVMANLDLGNGTGEWLTAGHRSPLLIDETGRLLELSPRPCLPLGMAIGSDRPNPESVAVELQAGQSLVLYSDGIVENIDLGTRATVGDEAFRAIVEDALEAELQGNVAREIVETLLKLTGPRLRDDATLLVVERTG